MQKNQFIALLYGWIAVFGIILLSSFILALILNFTAFERPGLEWATLIIGLLALFSGGIIAGIKGKAKGWMIGGTIGLGFSLIIFLIQYLGYQQGFSLEQSLYHLAYLGAALLGGIIGVNLVGASND
ncbi:TIGR04086 family membrane protein [Oceanobacillus saliphilus]|uniref:TIGR04086 family membrane protein n=1 Tax=Oceanobacillus saliphilus TaxID=2925834 RepID=UPI00201E09FF|nr:TIGR04086 family membrane protein [Oceanobacillus saliphilus]